MELVCAAWVVVGGMFLVSPARNYEPVGKRSQLEVAQFWRCVGLGIAVVATIAGALK